MVKTIKEFQYFAYRSKTRLCQAEQFKPEATLVLSIFSTQKTFKSASDIYKRK